MSPEFLSSFAPEDVLHILQSSLQHIRHTWTNYQRGSTCSIPVPFWMDCSPGVVPWVCCFGEVVLSLAVVGRIRIGFGTRRWLFRLGWLTRLWRKFFVFSLKLKTAARTSEMLWGKLVILAVLATVQRGEAKCRVCTARQWCLLWIVTFWNQLGYWHVHLFLHFGRAHNEAIVPPIMHWMNAEIGAMKALVDSIFSPTLSAASPELKKVETCLPRVSSITSLGSRLNNTCWKSIWMTERTIVRAFS